MPAPLIVDREDIRIALEKAQDIEDNGYPTAAACIRRCVNAAAAALDESDTCDPDCELCRQESHG